MTTTTTTNGGFGTPFPPRQHVSCANSNGSVSQYLACRSFPVSFQPLLVEWRALQQPALSTLRMPLGIGRGRKTDLQSITDAQHNRIANALARASSATNDDERLLSSHLFIIFASHLDVYSSVHTELQAYKNNLGVEQCAQLYDDTWQKLLQDFDKDRIGCLSGDRHDCIGAYIWGEMFSWPTLEIKRRYVAYRKRSSSSNWHACMSDEEEEHTPHFTTLLVGENNGAQQLAIRHYQAMLRDAAAQLEIASRLIGAGVSRRHQRRSRGRNAAQSFLRSSKTEHVERIRTL